MNSKVDWISIKVDLEKENWHDTIDSLNNIGNNLKAKRCKSALWYRIELRDKYRYNLQVGTHDLFCYEILIPNIKAREIDILKDLGYNVKIESNMSRKTRRIYYKRVKDGIWNNKNN